jgi:hypothetical protein
VTRLFSICSLAALLAFGGYLLTSHSGRRATAGQAFKAVGQAVQTARASSFRQAVLALEKHRVESGTYAGTDLSASSGVTLVRAAGTTYCLQAGAGTNVRHQTSTDAASASGPC